MSERVFPNKMEHFYIDVILKDGSYHHFTPRVLDVLLESHRVHKFKRASGWATVGIDRIRTGKRENTDYQGPERRIQAR